MHKHEPSLYKHSLRVGKLATDFYRFCGMEYTRGWSLIEGALLHDLGKICLPAAILIKPRELNDSEKRIIALHPSIGAELLEAQGYFAKPVVNIVRRHHERLDGSGYPDGWQRKRTARMVRIVAVCDAICAMTEERPYEDAWPWPEAMDRLRSMPEQYDFEIVAVIAALLEHSGATTLLDESTPAFTVSNSRSISGVIRPRSAFYPPRFRNGIKKN